MRVYIPATSEIVRQLIGAGWFGVPPIVAFAVTPALRDWYADDDVESLEYAAMLEAARASLRLLDADPSAMRRRVVVAADVADVKVRDEIDRAVVHIGVMVAMSNVASVHVDDPDAEPVIARAAEMIVAADLGDATAQEAVDDAEGFELSWYASQEVAALLEMG